jgi:lipopolysaccharide export system protein LptA
MSGAPWRPAKRSRRRARPRLRGALLAFFLWATAASGSPDAGGLADAPPRRPVRIQSEQLVAEMETDTVEFSGAVRVEGDGYTITADSLTIRFRPGTVGRHQAAGTVSAKEISRMTARGQVRIQSDTLTADAEQAVYEPGSGQLWLLAAEAPPAGNIARDERPAGAPGPRKVQPAARRPAPRVRVLLSPPAGR